MGKQEAINLKTILAICTKSKETVKLVSSKLVGVNPKFKANFAIIQLGDDKEPSFDGVHQFVGKLSMRKSASSFPVPPILLTRQPSYTCNGLNIPSTIIFGGSRPAGCFGYSENVNLKSAPECSPCWIHKGYEECENEFKCMAAILVEEVTRTFDSFT